MPCNAIFKMVTIAHFVEKYTSHATYLAARQVYYPYALGFTGAPLA